MRSSLEQQKRLLRFYRSINRAFLFFAFCYFVWFFFKFLPLEILKSTPASGGDTGSHFWPLYTLFHHGLFEGNFRVWNPGNLGGEPHLLHYFPFPFLLMALFGLLLPLGAAFNLGTILPIFILPFSAVFCFKGLGLKVRAQLLAGSLSLVFLYHEGFSMWGGNTLSTLAGQFAHLYAICFLLLVIGSWGYEIRKDKKPIVSGLLIAAMACSHAYVLLGMPFVALSFILFFPYSNLKGRLKLISISAIISLGLSIWFIMPMLENQAWTTPYASVWGTEATLRGALPLSLKPVAVTALGLFIFWLVFARLFSPKAKRKAFLKYLALLLLPALSYLALFFFLPSIGLVDIRALPQVQLLVCLLLALILSEVIVIFPRFIHLLIIPVLFLLPIWWAESHIERYPVWLKWNYSGWKDKPLSREFKELSDHIEPGFSKARIIYEHADVNDKAGSLRVFEMLPYFSRRSTLESVYLQASVLAPYAFYLQAKVSNTPSCPFSQFDCQRPLENFKEIEEQLDLMAVGGIISSSEDLKNIFRQSSEILDEKSFHTWSYFKLNNPPSYVEVLAKKPKFIDEKNWQQEFYKWFSSYKADSVFLTTSSNLANLSDRTFDELDNCEARVTVEVNRLKLETNCPGKLHALKFSFHPAWQSLSGERISMISPGFLALVPESEVVELRFGPTKIWVISSIISLITLLGTLVYSFKRPRFKA